MKKIGVIAGVDEAGRGALAGPVVAGAVIMGEEFGNENEDWVDLLNTKYSSKIPPSQRLILESLKDSKKLIANQRDSLFTVIVACFDYGAGIVSAEEIDQIGIKKATEKAMNIAVSRLKGKPTNLLIDGNDRFIFSVQSEDIIKGDEKIPAISAASIIAKVTRDRMMQDYDKMFPVFGFADHKGYGTESHRILLEQERYCEIHRKTYDPLKTVLTQGRLFSF